MQSLNTLPLKPKTMDTTEKQDVTITVNFKLDFTEAIKELDELRSQMVDLNREPLEAKADQKGLHPILSTRISGKEISDLGAPPATNPKSPA